MATTRKKEAPKTTPEIGVSVDAAPIVPETVDAVEETAFEAENSKALTIMIGNAVKQYSITDNAIEEMKQRLGGLTVTSVEDKAAYDVVKAGWQEVKNLRIAIEHKRKALNRNAIDYKAAVDAEAKRITSLLEEIEEPLKERKEWFDNEKLRLKAEEEQRKQQQFIERTNYLLQCGFMFNGSMYVLDTLHVTTNQIREFEDAQWIEVAARANTLSIERLEAKKRAEAEAQAAQQAQQAEMAAMIQERYETRTAWLQGRGVVLVGGQWMFGGVSIPDVSVRDYTKEAWQEAARKIVAAGIAPTVQPVAAVQQVAPQPQATAPQADPTILYAPSEYGTTATVPAPTQPEPPINVPSSEPVKHEPSVTEKYYAEGFRACQAILITRFHDGQQRTRAQWIQLIENLKPTA